MSKLVSTTIREDNIPTYIQLREHLKKNNTSLGDYLIGRYRAEMEISTLDERRK